MKIIEITNDENIYTVKQAPNWIERMFGVKEKVRKYKRARWETYMFGGGSVYYDQTGKELGNNSRIGLAIDNWRRSF